MSVVPVGDAAPDNGSPVVLALQEAARCALDGCALGSLSQVQRYQLEAISTQMAQQAVSVFLTVLADYGYPTIELADGATIYARAFPSLALAVESIDAGASRQRDRREGARSTLGAPAEPR